MRLIVVVASVTLLLGGCTTATEGVGQTAPSTRASTSAGATATPAARDIQSVIPLWSNRVDFLLRNSPDADQHYSKVFAGILPDAAGFEFRHLVDHGGSPVDVVFVSRPVGYDSGAVQRLRYVSPTGRGPQSLSTRTSAAAASTARQRISPSRRIELRYSSSLATSPRPGRRGSSQPSAADPVKRSSAGPWGRTVAGSGRCRAGGDGRSWSAGR